MRCSIGLDFGSTCCRALAVDLDAGTLIASASSPYRGGENGIFTDPADPRTARQEPDAYIESMRQALCAMLKKADHTPGFSRNTIVGIGVDATSATLIPVTQNLEPVSRLPQFKDNLNAFAWMWKDHTASKEAEEITAVVQKRHPEYLKRCGGSCSSEWLWPKALHALRIDRKLFETVYLWMELEDFIPAQLAGISDASALKISVCGAGHKGLYSSDWGGFPDRAMLAKIAPELALLRDRMPPQAFESNQIAGYLCPQWAEILGLPTGIPLAVGIIDAHSGAVGSGVGADRMAAIIGTSGCQMMVAPAVEPFPGIPGICGVVKGSILPGYYGFEAGQAAVGDSFFWQAGLAGVKPEHFGDLEKEAAKIAPGSSGILALDWLNGNRNPFCNTELRALMLGMNLNTTLPELYRAWMESTAFGLRQIVENFNSHQIFFKTIVCGGGIPEKSPLLMQIYADVQQMTLQLPGTQDVCALGSAIFGAVAGGAFPDAVTAQKKLCTFKTLEYRPNSANKTVYDKLYTLYRTLSETFAQGALSSVIKELNEIKKGVRG